MLTTEDRYELLRRVMTGAVVVVRASALLPIHSPLLLQLTCTDNMQTWTNNAMIAWCDVPFM